MRSDGNEHTMVGAWVGVRTSVNDILAVEVVDGLEDLSYGLRSILLCESALLANAVE